MNRLLLGEVKTYLSGIAGLAGVYIGTSLESNYLVELPKKNDAVWLMSQTLTRLGNTSGYSSIQRQRMNAELYVRIVSPRNADGVVDAETALDAKVQAVLDALYAWRPASGDTEIPFTITRYRDGMPFDTVVAADLIIASTVVFSKQA